MSNKEETPEERRSCYDCLFLKSALSWWCTNKDACKARGTSFPGVIHCPYWERDLKFNPTEEYKQNKMDKKYNIAKAINILVCMGIVVAIMLCAYNAWSLNGEYTLFSFFASLVVHGGLGIMIYCGVDWILRRVFHQIK